MDGALRIGAFLACALGAGLALLGPAAAREPAFAFPEVVAGFSRGARTDYEPRAPGFGYSVTYAKGAMKADVYIYDGSVAGIPDGAGSEAVAGQVTLASREIRTAVERGFYRSSTDKGAVQIGQATGTGPACRAFTIDHPAIGSVESLLCVTGLRGRFVKFRLSGPASSFSGKDGESFVTDWLGQQ